MIIKDGCIEFNKIYDTLCERIKSINDYLSYTSFLFEVLFVVENSISTLSRISIPYVKDILIKIISMSLEFSSKDMLIDYENILIDKEFLANKVNKDFINTINLEIADVKKEAMNKLKHFKNILNKIK